MSISNQLAWSDCFSWLYLCLAICTPHESCGVVIPHNTATHVSDRMGAVLLSVVMYNSFYYNKQHSRNQSTEIVPFIMLSIRSLIHRFTMGVKLRVAHVLEMSGTFSPPPRVSDPDMHHGTCVTNVPWCMLIPLTSGLLCRRREKRSRHSRACSIRNFAYLVRAHGYDSNNIIKRSQSEMTDGKTFIRTYQFTTSIV